MLQTFPVLIEAVCGSRNIESRRVAVYNHGLATVSKKKFFFKELDAENQLNLSVNLK